MADRLKSIVRFTGVAPGATATLPHELNINGVGRVPDTADRSDWGFAIVSITATEVTVRNDGAVNAGCDVKCEVWHSENRAFGAVGTTSLSPRPFIPGEAQVAGGGYAFRFTAAGGEGSDFNIQLPAARVDDSYAVLATPADQDAILGFHCPDDAAGDRTDSQFRMVTSAPVVAGDSWDIWIAER